MNADWCWTVLVDVVGVVVRHAPLRTESSDRRRLSGGDLPVVAPILPVLAELRAALTGAAPVSV